MEKRMFDAIMNTMKRISVLFLILLLLGCPGSPQWKLNQGVPPDANIKLVTHPKLIEGLEFVDGFSLELPGTFSMEENERLAKYNVYERGYRDVIVLLEIQENGDRGSWDSKAYGGSGGLVGVEPGMGLVTICKSN